MRRDDKLVYQFVAPEKIADLVIEHHKCIKRCRDWNPEHPDWVSAASQPLHYRPAMFTVQIHTNIYLTMFFLFQNNLHLILCKRMNKCIIERNIYLKYYRTLLLFTYDIC